MGKRGNKCHNVTLLIKRFRSAAGRPAAEFFGIAGKKHETASEAGEQIIRFAVGYSQSTIPPSNQKT